MIVPMKIAGGVAPLETISAMKLAVSPIIATSEQSWMMRAQTKVAPRSPWGAIFFSFDSFLLMVAVSARANR